MVRRHLRLVGPGLVLLAWLLVGDVFHAHPLLLPPLLETLRHGYSLFTEAHFVRDIISTLRRWLIGYALALIAGVPMGLALGSWRPLYESVEVVIEFLRSLPVTALFPLFLLLWGIQGDKSMLAMIFTAALFPALIASMYGVTTVQPTRRNMARTFGATPLQIFRTISAYEALPSIAIAARTALSGSLVVCIVAEFFMGSEFGIGARLFEVYSRSQPADLYAILLVLGAMGYAANILLAVVERYALFWVGK